MSKVPLSSPLRRIIGTSMSALRTCIPQLIVAALSAGDVFSPSHHFWTDFDGREPFFAFVIVALGSIIISNYHAAACARHNSIILKFSRSSVFR